MNKHNRKNNVVIEDCSSEIFTVDTFTSDENPDKSDDITNPECIVDLVTNPEYNDLPKYKLKEAFNTFSDVTGYKPINNKAIIDEMISQQKLMTKFNSYYPYLAIFIVNAVIIVMLTIFRIIDPILMSFLLMISFVILYSFSIVFRMHVTDSISNRINNPDDIYYTIYNSSNFEDTVAYWPKGFVKMACSITGEDDSFSDSQIKSEKEREREREREREKNRECKNKNKKKKY